MSKVTLGDYYKAVQEAVAAMKAGNKPAWFGQYAGLCHNLYRYCYCYDHRNLAKSTFDRLESEQENLFLSAGLDIIAPFNNGSFEEYEYDDHWNNEKRLAWVKEHATP